ncbi:LuxR C-terminal-related transcriptional regulator [Pseudomonas mangiferae]|uniref:AAA family ATPase n=1 Tax=Pseudomonas mangiferae TaxID=2593654 RepID=A0A553GZN8_9PSED|nr:LuxR C-terminal-related transcriptional regulator [Pseudomonas mangiferae]TRX74950.1 AAA family ATPase [Pseudomonas mangiferae]
MSTQALRAPLLRTKLFPPDHRGRALLPRQVLIDRLFNARGRRVIVLSAPAGFGKSTALSQLRERLQAAGAKVAWLSCDEKDSEPPRMLQYVAAAIEDVCPGFGRHTGRLLQGDVSLPVELLLEAFIGELRRINGELYLVFDDFHRVSHTTVETCIRYLIERLPANIHLIASTRFSPRLSFEPHQACVLNAEDLRLRPAETERYLRELKRFDLQPGEVDLLHARTEGWITALHLASLALARHPDRGAFLAGLSGTERNIADYLVEDVLSQLPVPLQAFLERTSVLDEFCADLCNALTGRDDGAEMLQRLQAEQLFIIPLDGQDEWFRYHHLFAEFLQGRLTRSLDSTPLLLAAARWCERHGQPERGVKYALRGRDYEVAAAMLERHGARIIAGNRVYGILAVLKGVPAEVMQERPVFQLFYAWQLAFEQKFAEAEALIKDIGTRLSKDHAVAPRRGLVELLAVAHLLKALVLLYQDKLDGCLQVVAQWLPRVTLGQPVYRASLYCIQAAAYAMRGAFCEAATAIAMTRDSLKLAQSEYLDVITSLVEALICKERGDLVQAQAIVEAERARLVRLFGPHSPVSGPLVLVHADLLYERDRHQSVLAELPEALEGRDVATPMELIARGRLVLDRARFYRGETGPALAQLEAWLDGLQGPGNERAFALGTHFRVQLLLWVRRVGEAERACQQLQRHLAELPAGRYQDVHATLALSEARLALVQGHPERAQLSLEECLARQTSEYQRDRRLRMSLLLAVAYWRQGREEKAFGLFRATLEEAWGGGYRRLLLDDALWLLPLWSAWMRHAAHLAPAWAGFVERLREQCRTLAVDPEAFDDAPAFTPKERTILRLVAAGLPNREIANTVHLSEATIKWHLHKLFAKLGVRSRTQAVLEGKRLGLLGEG